MIGITLLTLMTLLTVVIYDKLINHFVITSTFLSFFKLMFVMLRAMASIRGVISFIIVWTAVSGVGLTVTGIISGNSKLIVIGGLVFAFWAGPFTPMLPLVIALAMLFQRYILRDKSVSIQNIKERMERK